MIPVIYEKLCNVCNGDLSHREIEAKSCNNFGKPLHAQFQDVEEHRLEAFFEKTVGKPRSIQKFWIRRLAKGESFAAVAPTGIGKTTFGVVSSLFFALEKKKCYIIVPTLLLVQQCVENLVKFCKKLGINVSVNEKGKLAIGYYHGKMSLSEKLKFQEMGIKGEFDILVTTTQFLSAKFEVLKGSIFDFIFVDDVDAILKSSRNITRILILLGFKRVRERWVGKPKGILMVSTATVKKGKAALLFRDLLNFDVGASFFTVRNIEDIVVNTEDIGEIKKIVKTMGKGCIIYARSVEEAEKYYELLRKEFKIGIVVSGKKSDYELFEKGEIDHLIGTAYYYGKLIRGLDLPEKIRYVIFIGVPIIKTKYEDLTARALKILALAFRKNEEVRKYLHLLPTLENHPKEMEKLKEVIKKVSTIEESEDVLIRGDEVLFPNVTIYLQGSGRSSRLTVNGLTRGASFIFERDEKLLDAFIRRGLYYNISFKTLDEVDLTELAREIDESREKKGIIQDLILPALFIVESPTKARLIARFFGKPSVKVFDDIIVYEVAAERHILLITASLGHIVDLTTDKAFHGVKIEEDEFIPIYSSIKRCKRCGYQFTVESNTCRRCGSNDLDDSKGRVNSLRRLAYEAGLAIIGTDPDAEGEKIAWDISNMLSGLANIKRVEFHEVTPRAIREALLNPREIDENLVKAQIVRRIEDRWIGFSLTQKLWEAFDNRNISAGRVQTPVLKWIIEREKEFHRKKKVAYIPEFDLYLEEVEDEELEIEVELLEEVKELRIPQPPYTTDEMLKDANNILSFSSSLTIKLAQNLFEGGLITYHRTDSTYVSEAGMRVASEYLGEEFKGRNWRIREGAHECIRPTRPWDKELLQKMLYEGVIHTENITSKHLALYDLIFRRFMASQCREFEVKIRKYEVKYGTNSIVEERIINVQGKAFELYKSVKIKGELPQGRIKVKPRFIEVPEGYPYTQADIVRLMKERSIGRPSTYATIIEKLFLRKYISEKKRWLFPTELGKKVCDYLITNYGSFVSEERSRKLLEKMDYIEVQKLNYEDVLKEIYNEVKEIG